MSTVAGGGPKSSLSSGLVCAAVLRTVSVGNMAAVSKYLTAKNSAVAGGVLLVLYFLKQRRRSAGLNRYVKTQIKCLMHEFR